jgi:hypothetical protein
MTPETCTTSNAQRTDRDETANVALANAFAIFSIEEDENYIRLSTFGQQVACWPTNSPQGNALLELEAERRAAPTLPADVKGLVERLQAGCIRTGEGDNGEDLYDVEGATDDMWEAAATLTAQAALLESARQVIKPFAEIAAEYADQEDDEFQVWKDFDVLGATLPLKIFRAASRLHHEMGADRG